MGFLPVSVIIFLLISVCYSRKLSVSTHFRANNNGEASNRESLDLRMPGVTPLHNDHYMCTATPVRADDHYIIKFNPEAKMDTAHHMLLFGCESLAITDRSSWDCELTYTLCRKGMKILYAWARNAPSRELPKDVGFRVGKRSGINYLVLQVHYAHSLQDKDYSGMELVMTDNAQKYIAGIFLMAAFQAYIPPHTVKTHADISCQFRHNVPIHPFAFRTHAHTLGRVISGYIYNRRTGEWTVIGKGNPQWPQSFYPTDEIKTVSKGDILLARCTYNSTTKDKPTIIGPTAGDEMCNLYIMYYTDSKYGDAYDECGSNNFPQLMSQLPAGNDVPMPPNPALDEFEKAEGAGADGKSVTASLPSGGDEEDKDVVIADTLTESQESSVGHMLEVTSWHPKVELGDVGGVACDGDNNVHIFHRAGIQWTADTFDMSHRYMRQGDGPIRSAVVLKVDRATGAVMSQWGERMFYLPHGLFVDDSDNIWLTDVALHQVFKFGPGGGNGTPLLTLGTKFEPGSDLTHFCKPADVAVALTGEIFVADGYCNSRIMKFSPDGKLLQQWSIIVSAAGGSADERENSVHSRKMDHLFHIPHSITILDNKKRGGGQVVCVSDRENALIVCFDFNGKFLAQFGTLSGVETVYAIAYHPSNGGLLYGVSGPSSMPFRSARVTGFTIAIDKLVVADSWQPAFDNFSTPHTLAVCPSGTEVYVGEINPSHVRKFSPLVKPEEQKAQHDQYDAATETISPPKKKYMSAATAMDGKTSQVEGGSAATGSDEKAESGDVDSGGVAASIIVISILAVPIVIIIMITVCVRLRKHQRSSRHAGFNIAQWMHSYRSPTMDKFNIGGLLSRHHGFDRVNTEESDHEVEPYRDSDSDVEEFTAAGGATVPLPPPPPLPPANTNITQST